MTQTMAVLGASPEGIPAVDPVYVRYAPPDKVVARPAVPHWSGPKLTPAGLDTVNPAVEPAYVKTGVGMVTSRASAVIAAATSDELKIRTLETVPCQTFP